MTETPQNKEYHQPSKEPEAIDKDALEKQFIYAWEVYRKSRILSKEGEITKAYEVYKIPTSSLRDRKNDLTQFAAPAMVLGYRSTMNSVVVSEKVGDDTEEFVYFFLERVEPSTKKP